MDVYCICIVLVLHWHCLGIALFFCTGVAMVLHRFCVGVVAVLSWYCVGIQNCIVLVLQLYCIEVVLVLFCCCTRSMLVMC